MDETIQDDAPVYSIFDKFARLVLFATIFLLPIFAIPVTFIPLGFTKTALFICGTAIAAILFVIARLRDGEISLPSGMALPLLGLIVLATAVSTLASGAVPLSWGGVWFEASSFSFILSLAVFLFLCAALFKNTDHIFYAYIIFISSAALLALFHIIRFVGGPGIFSFNFFSNSVSTPLGSWSDLSVFFGAVAVFLLSTIEFMKLHSALRIIFYAALVVSLMILAAVNTPLVWVLVGIFSLVFLVYLISFKHMERARYEDVLPTGVSVDSEKTSEDKPEEKIKETPSKRRLHGIPSVSFSVFLCSVIFVIFSGTIGNIISGFLGSSFIEARPSFGATMEIARQTLSEDAFFGAGPNMFVRKWLQFKPEGTNQTIFWNSDFTSGVGFLPTQLITGGIVGVIFWILFFASYLWSGFKFILSVKAEKVSRYLVGAGFLSSLFLWSAFLFYSPGPVVLALAFSLTGLSVAALSVAGALSIKRLQFSDKPSLSFASVLALILVFLCSVAVLWSVGSRFASSVEFNRGLRAATERGNIDEAGALILHAAELSPLDMYARTLTDIELARLNNLLSTKTSKDANAEKIQTDFQNILGNAISYGRSAVALGVGNYANWMSLGRVYASVVPLKIEGAYDSAKSAYGEAMKLNPKSPAILLAYAQLEAAKGDGEKAREFIVKSLQMKSNYTEAVFLLSQIEVQEGNIKAAIKSVDAATVLSPNDPTIRFQLGLLKYNENDWAGAARAFERAVSLNANYSNARYFLGLAYDKLGRDKEAVAQFEELVKTNPSNEEVALVLKNLKSGRSPFVNAEPPVDSKPEKRQMLPVKESE